MRWTALAVLLAVSAMARADDAAKQILDRSRQLSETSRKWTDRVQHLQLKIIDRRGGERNRELVIYFKKYPEERNRSLLFFESPPEVKGVGFLQLADPHAKDEQWLYLPELKRVRQIGGGARHESFVGTDFSYDDLAIISEITDWTDADARTALRPDETVGGQACHVIEFTPTGKDVTYSKIRMWITAEDLVVLKYEMDDKSGKLEKVLTFGGIKSLGTIPTAFQMEMQNVQGGSRTVVQFTDVKYDSGLDDGRFTQRALEHGPES